MNAANTVFDAKRLIGRKFTDEAVKADMKHWPFTVVSGAGGKPAIQVTFKGEEKTFAPEEMLNFFADALWSNPKLKKKLNNFSRDSRSLRKRKQNTCLNK